MNFRRLTFLGPVFLLLTLFGSAYAVYTLTVGQTVTVNAPFTVNVVSSSTGITCSGTQTITCNALNLLIGQTETLTATVTFTGATSVSATSASTAPTIVSVTPAGPVTLNSGTPSQIFTVNALAAGSASITLTFQ